jgi:hypothetical protein
LILQNYSKKPFLTQYSIIPTTDMGFACSGFVFPANPPDTGIQDCWVLKIDSAGCENPGQCWVGTHEIIVKTFDPDNPFVIYPNPAHEKITVEFHQNDTGAEIELEDHVGKTLSRGHLAAMKSEYVINLKPFTGGIYFIRVTQGSRVITKKIIKLE